MLSHRSPISMALDDEDDENKHPASYSPHLLSAVVEPSLTLDIRSSAADETKFDSQGSPLRSSNEFDHVRSLVRSPLSDASSELRLSRSSTEPSSPGHTAFIRSSSSPIAARVRQAQQRSSAARMVTPRNRASLVSGYSVATELLDSPDEEEEEVVAEDQPQREGEFVPTWSDLTDSPGKPKSMSGQTMVCYARSAYVFGGYDEGQALQECYAYDLDTLIWQKLEVCGDVPSPRTSHSAVVDHQKGKMYVLCGSGSAFGHTNLGDFFEFDMKLRLWSKLEFQGDELTPRYGQSTVMYQDKLFVFGGTFGRDFSQEMYVLNLTTKRISKVACTGTYPSPRYKHSAGVVQKTGEMMVFAGAERLNYRLSDVYLLNLTSYRWTQVKCSGDVPPGRFAHTMSMSSDGSKAFVFGGTDRVNCFNDLYEFDVEKRFWRKVPTAGTLPKARYFHSACLDADTGNLYVWGGKGSTSQQVRFADLYRIQVEHTEKTNSTCTLVQDLTDALFNEDMVDTAIHCQNGIVVNAHDAILKARLGSSCSDLMYLAQRMHSNVVDMILFFIYSDNLIIAKNIAPLDYLLVLIAAVKLRLNRLAKLSFKRIQEMISRKFAVELLDTIKFLGCENQLPMLEKYLLLYTNLHFGQGKLKDAAESAEEFLVTVPESTISSDLLKLRKPLSIVSVSKKTFSPSRKSTKKLIETSPSHPSIFLPPCDLKFHFGLKEPSPIEINAHSMILAARSKYFASPSFREIMLEGQNKVCVFPGVEDDVAGTLSPSAFSFLLDYLYGGRSVLQNLSYDFAKEFVQTDVCNYFGLSTNELFDKSVEMMKTRRGSRSRDTRSRNIPSPADIARSLSPNAMRSLSPDADGNCSIM